MPDRAPPIAVVSRPPPMANGPPVSFNPLAISPPFKVGAPFEPLPLERQLVEALAFYGATQERICQFIRRLDGKGFPRPIDRKTLRAHFGQELDAGPTRMLAEIAATLHRTALDPRHKGHVPAAIFLLKSRGGWTDKPLQGDYALTGIAGQDAARPPMALDLEGATPEEVDVIERFLIRRAGALASADPAALAGSFVDVTDAPEPDASGDII